ncbi:MAG: hypothetical protein LC790_11830 [Actinobacteria bacterium]|nr:hypothetical protein [Actinomycetota bacterium]
MPNTRRSHTSLRHSTSGSEIERLKALPRCGRGEQTRERRDVQRDLQTRPSDATAVRARDVRGYGSDCQWSQ